MHTAKEPDSGLLALANDEEREVLVFKMAVALGFDAPRAFTLVSMRASRNPDFGVQLDTDRNRIVSWWRRNLPHKPWSVNVLLPDGRRFYPDFVVGIEGRKADEGVHVVTEAIKLAMAYRDAYYGDPAFVGVPLGALLSDAYTAVRRPLIDTRRASIEARPGDPYRLRPLLAVSVAGGDLQDQVTLGLLLDVIEFDRVPIVSRSRRRHRQPPRCRSG